MSSKVYDLMNWREIEAIVYSECDHPEEILGAHKTEDGILVQAFIPGAVKVELHSISGKKKYEMEQEDEEGYFAVLLPEQAELSYQYLATFEDDSTRIVPECYGFDSDLSDQDIQTFEKGECVDAQSLLGAHIVEKKGQKGVLFRVYAPNAMRVSVVGTFNDWDGRFNQMSRVGDSGFFELFIPGVEAGASYQYEIKTKTRVCMLKTDPYALKQELGDQNASVVVSEKEFDWKDAEFVANRKKQQASVKAMSIYEVYLGAMLNASKKKKAGYKEFAKEIVNTVQELGYTHVNLLPLMEYPVDASLGYQTIGYFTPTCRYGCAEGLKYLVNELHKAGVFVLMDFTPAQFPMDDFGLRFFDGSNLYEADDERMKYQANGQAFKFDFGKAAANNLLMSAALYWVSAFHMDGLRINALDTMLYLNYDKKEEDSARNVYGGFENLEAIDFVKKLSQTMKKQFPGTLLWAQESNAWPTLTDTIKNGGLGFDYNTKLQRDQWLLAGKDGDAFDAGLKMYYGYRMTKTFSKVISNTEAINENAKKVLVDLQKLYKKHAAMQQSDNLCYIPTELSNQGLDVYCRSGKKNDNLLFVANQTNEAKCVYVKVAEEGTYKLIFDTDDVKYGGSTKNAKEVLYALAQQIGDAYVSEDYYVKICIPANTMRIYQYAPYTKTDLEQIEWLRLKARRQGLVVEIERLAQSITELTEKKDALETTKKEIEVKMEAYKSCRK